MIYFCLQLTWPQKVSRAILIFHIFIVFLVFSLPFQIIQISKEKLLQFDFLKITGGKILEDIFIFVPFSKLFELAASFGGQVEEELLLFQIKATSIRGVTLTAAHLDSCLNFSQLTCMAKFKIEPKCAAVKVTSPTEVILQWSN